MPMPRFLSPFKRSGHGMRSDYDGSTRTSYYDNSQPQYSGPMSRSSPRNRSCWPKFFHKRGRDREPRYTSNENFDYSSSVPGTVPSLRRSQIDDDYPDSSYENSATYSPYVGRDSYMPNSSFVGSLTQERGSYTDSPPREPLIHEGEPISMPMPMPTDPERSRSSLSQFQELRPSVTNPTEDYTSPYGGPRAVRARREPLDHEGEPISMPMSMDPEQSRSSLSQFQETFPSEVINTTDNYASAYSGPRSVRARRGEPITAGDVRIEVEDDGRYRNGRYRSRGSSYSSQDSAGYTHSLSGSESYTEPPVMISADPNTDIEIGNERDGFIPYQQYLAQVEARRRTNGHRRRRPRSHRSSEDEQVYIIPPGANVIFVDEEGRELHRVGHIDEHRYPPRRHNSHVRTTRQPDGSYLIEL